jgi:hypothetical protein
MRVVWATAGLLLAGAALTPLADRLRAARQLERRLEAVAEADAGSCATPLLALLLPSRGPWLQSWQTVGGCGAGASTGTAGGVKWIGRNVRGGLFRVECQANYVDTPDGYNFVGTTLITHDLTPRWTLGVGVPYLYKYMRDPYRVRVNLANKGPGDVNLLATRRLGGANAWSATLVVGLPTGAHDTRFRSQLLTQDRQLGLGMPTASFVIDHTIDNLWGPIVLGGTANWRGGENALGSYRAPTTSIYGYASYLLGPFAPAAGLSVTRFFGSDRDLGEPQALPAASVAANLSLEWASDLVALLVGVSVPYDLRVQSTTVARHNRLGAWIVAFGASFAAF